MRGANGGCSNATIDGDRRAGVTGRGEVFNLLEGGDLKFLATKPRFHTHDQYLVGKFDQAVEL